MGRMISKKIERVCPYAYYECKLPADTDCPRRAESDCAKQTSTYLKWAHSMARRAEDCSLRGAKLSQKGYIGRYKLLPPPKKSREQRHLV